MPGWLWFGLIGGLLAPLVIMWSSIRVAFEERGIVTGLAVWSGACWLTVPLMLLIMWVAHWFVG